MRRSPLLRLLGMLGLLGLAAGTHGLTVRAAPNTPGAPDLAGRVRRPVDEARKQKKIAAVLFFVTTDCPIANRYAPEINRICRDYGSRRVACYIVQVDASLQSPAATAHARAFGFKSPVLLDRKHELVQFCGASVTPEAAVLSASGQVLYRGRIDDRYASLSRARTQPSRRDLRLALDAICAGHKVTTPRTTATGCIIEG